MCALPCSDVRDCLTVVDGILVKGKAVVLPQALIPLIKRRLRSVHQGRDSMLRRARETVYWPNIAIKQITNKCETCLEMKPQNPQEPVRKHSDSDSEIAGKHYLAVVNYYSNFFEIGLLTTIKSVRILTLLKKHRACYCIPRMIMSDGVPQFTSQEFNSSAEGWYTNHVTSSPMHQRANGKAESAIKIRKSLLVKTPKERGDAKQC